MLPSPNEIIYFLEVAKCLNLSRASERLGVTQPTLSISIKRLEENIGEKLLIRTKTGVQLTKFGKRFLASAQKILEEWERLRAMAISEEKEIQGQYSIGCHPSVALYTLSHFLPELLQKYPKLEIQLIHDISRRITEQVITYKVDFGLVVNPVEHADLVIINLTKDVVTFWSNKNNKNTDVLICDQNLLQVQSLVKQMKAAKFKFSRVIHCANLEVITDLVSGGCGVGIIPTKVVQRNAVCKLVHFGKKPPKFDDRIDLVYRYDAQRSLAARKIIDAIKQIFT